MLQDRLQELHEALEKILVWHTPDGFASDAHRLARQERLLIVLSHLLLEVLPQRLDMILVVEPSLWRPISRSPFIFVWGGRPRR